MRSTAENENAPQALGGGSGTNAKQQAHVSIAHVDCVSYPDVFDETALAFATMAAGSMNGQEVKDGVTTDNEAVAALRAAGWPLRITDIESANGELVTLWSLDWFGDVSSNAAEEWLQHFLEGLDQIRTQATGADRLTLERLNFYFEDVAHRQPRIRPALPSSADNAAIARRVRAGAQ